MPPVLSFEELERLGARRPDGTPVRRPAVVAPVPVEPAKPETPAPPAPAPVVVDTQPIADALGALHAALPAAVQEAVQAAMQGQGEHLARALAQLKPVPAPTEWFATIERDFRGGAKTVHFKAGKAPPK